MHALPLALLFATGMPEPRKMAAFLFDTLESYYIDANLPEFQKSLARYAGFSSYTVMFEEVRAGASVRYAAHMCTVHARRTGSTHALPARMHGTSMCGRLFLEPQQRAQQLVPARHAAPSCDNSVYTPHALLPPRTQRLITRRV
jgi:hypothetical protein